MIYSNLLLLAFLAASRARALLPDDNNHQRNQTAILRNGAELSISITDTSNLTYYSNHPTTLEGTASVGLGHPDVAYIYIVTYNIIT